MVSVALFILVYREERHMKRKVYQRIDSALQAMENCKRLDADIDDSVAFPVDRKVA